MNLDINVEEIFKLYDIQDRIYLENCKKALGLAKEDKELLGLIEKLCADLYDHGDYYVLEEIRGKTYQELFGEFADNQFLTNLVALVGLASNNDGYEEKEIIRNILLYGSDGMRVRQMVFISHIIGSRMLFLEGFRFQYITGKENGNILIHISKDADLIDFPKIVEKALEQIKARWNLNLVIFECESWMLSKEIVDCLSVDSRILQFQNNFDICRGTNCNVDILKFVFGISETVKQVDYAELAEDTSLQKNIKQKLLSGNEFYYGVGTLKNEILGV